MSAGNARAARRVKTESQENLEVSAQDVKQRKSVITLKFLKK